MIQVENLVRQYGSFTALHGISFTAETGQITGFLGPNGAGKTTTMRILSGYMPPTSGRAQVAGFDVFEQSMQVRQRVGYLLESVPLYRDMTPRQWLLYLGRLRRLGERRERTDTVLAQVQLASRADDPIRTLSKGMRQRVGLAGALLHNPPVLILDEPTIGLDPLQVMELRQLIGQLREQRTVLLSTHILSEAEQICDRVIIMNQGRLVAQGTPQQMRETLARGGRVLLRMQSTPAGIDRLARHISTMAHVLQVDSDGDALIVTPRQPRQRHPPRPGRSGTAARPAAAGDAPARQQPGGYLHRADAAGCHRL